MSIPSVSLDGRGRGPSTSCPSVESETTVVNPATLDAMKKITDSYLQSFAAVGIPHEEIIKWTDKRKAHPCPAGGWKGAEVFVYWDVEVSVMP